MDASDLIRYMLLFTLPFSLAGKSIILGWLAWTMWGRRPPSSMSIALRRFYGWITIASVVFTGVFARLCWEGRDNDLSLGWLAVLLILDLSTAMTAYWGLRVRDHYLDLSHEIRIRRAIQDIREEGLDRREEEQDRRDGVMT